MGELMRKTSVSQVLLLACHLAVVSGGVHASEQPTIAVLDFRAYNTSLDNAAIVAQFVRTAVVKSQTFAVVDKSNMDKVLTEQAFQQTGCVSEVCAVKLGRILDVRTVLMGAYGLFVGRRVVSAQLVDVETGRITASESQSMPDVADAERVAERLVRKLLTAAHVEKTAGEIVREDGRGGAKLLEARVPPPSLELPRQRSSGKWWTYGAVMAAAFVILVTTI